MRETICGSATVSAVDRDRSGMTIGRGRRPRSSVAIYDHLALENIIGRKGPTLSSKVTLRLSSFRCAVSSEPLLNED
jgi:hypothetical protein